jgi:hypothetical protein
MDDIMTVSTDFWSTIGAKMRASADDFYARQNAMAPPYVAHIIDYRRHKIARAIAQTHMIAHRHGGEAYHGPR